MEGEHRNEWRDSLNDFKCQKNIKVVVGVIGGCEGLDLVNTRQVLTPAFQMMATRERVAVLSGGTKGGVPELAMVMARELGMPTIGVYPEGEEKYALKDLLDFPIAVPKPIYGDGTWGTESGVLTAIPEAIIVIGGSWGTMVEVAMIMKRNISKEKHGQRVTLLIPMAGTGGVAEWLTSEEQKLPVVRNSVVRIDDSASLSKIICGIISL